MLTLGGEPFALSRLIDGKSKDVNAKLGDPNQLRSVDETKAQIVEKIAPRLSSYIAEAKRMAVNALKPIIEQKQKLTDAHQSARKEFDAKAKDR